jgi:hypothetical protein
VAAFPASADSRPNTCEPAKGGHSNTRDNDVSVDFTVKLPAGVRYAPQAVNGGVTALGLKSDVDASSVNGNVKVETTGLVHASSVNGSIEATMGATSWSGPLGFSTVNGSIDATMPPGINAEVHATTVSGSLKSDFPMNPSGEISKKEHSRENWSWGPGVEALDRKWRYHSAPKRPRDLKRHPRSGFRAH